jgi:nicotinamide-nucleotide amidase
VARVAGALEIVTIGNELLRGDVVDGNAAWLGRTLALAGIRVVRRVTVGDEDNAIRAAVSEALRRTGVVICTGGLGPTSDDRTKPVVAALYERALRLDAAVLADIERLFSSRGRQMPDINRSQAEVPEGATVFPNPAGTAPGLALSRRDLGLAILLPGVPLEVRALVQDGGVLDFLCSHWAGALRGIARGILRTTGIAESALFERVRDLVPEVAPVEVAFLPGVAGVDVRFTHVIGAAPPATVADHPERAAHAAAERVAPSDPALEAAMRRFRARIEDVLYADDDRDLAGIVGAMLLERGWMIAVAESCTGGLLGARLTDVAGSSAYVDGGVISYANDAKRRWFGVRAESLRRHGAVSETVALEMVDGVCEASGAACGLSITGIAGPAGGTPEKPVGTVWIGVRVNGRSRARAFRFGGSRGEIRERAAQAALRELQLELGTAARS